MTKSVKIALAIAGLLLLLGAAGYGYLVNGAMIKRVYLSSDSAVASYAAKGQEVLFDYQVEDLRMFVVSEDSGPQLYALRQKLGMFWVYDFPSYHLIYSLFTIGDDLYVFNLSVREKTVYLLAEDGTRLDPIKEQPIHIPSSPDPDAFMVRIMRVENYLDHVGENYQLVRENQVGEITNSKTDEFDFDEIRIHLLTRDGGDTLIYTPEQVGEFTDDRASVIDVLLQTMADKSGLEISGFEGSKLPTTQKDISTKTTLGNYIKIEGRQRVFSWTHTVHYQLHLNGDYYKNVLQRSETNYKGHSLFEAGLSKGTTYYRVESSDALNAIYDLFYPQAIEPPEPIKAK